MVNGWFKARFYSWAYESSIVTYRGTRFESQTTGNHQLYSPPWNEQLAPENW